MSTATLRDDEEGTADLPEVLQFMQVLWAVVHGLERTSKRMSQMIGVTGPQRLVLRVVGLFPGVSAGRLAAILHVHPSTLTGVLQRLVDQQLIQRVADPGDRRRAVLRLTRRGTHTNARGRGTVEAAIAEALDHVSARDREITARVLARLTAQLNQIPDPQAPSPVATFASARRAVRRRAARRPSRHR